MRKIIEGALLFVLLLSVVGVMSAPNQNGSIGGVSTPDPNIRVFRNPGDENVTSYPINNPDFSSYVYSESPRNWWTLKGGTDSGYIYDNWYSTSGYKLTPCVGIYMYQPGSYQSSKKAYEYWYQDWVYNGTIPPTSANLTFKWKFSTSSNYRLTGSNNTLSIWIQYPAGSGSGTALLRRVINGTSTYVANQWYTETKDIKNYLTASSNTTKYRIMLRFDCQTTGNNQYGGYFYTYWDDVIITARYAPLFPPRDLKVIIVGTSTNKTYTNSRFVQLSISGRALNRIGFSNDKLSWQLFDPVTLLNWTLTPGDGVKTVYFNASNSKGVAEPVNDTIIFDGTTPYLPNLASPSNGTITNDVMPTFNWALVSDRGPSGMAGYLVEVHPVPTFDSSNNRTVFVNASTYTPAIDLSPGYWYWRIASQDKADNMNYSAVRVIAVDNIPPERVALDSPTEGFASNSATPALSWSAAFDNPPFATGIASYTLQIDTDSSFSNSTGRLLIVPGIFGTSYTVPSIDSLADGAWHWRVNATDLAGNVGYAYTRSFIVDTVAPLPPSASFYPGEGMTVEGTKPTFSWGQVPDAVQYIIEIDDSSDFGNHAGNRIQVIVTTNSYTPPVDLYSGTWYWRVASKDAAGNVGSFTAGMSFITTLPNPMMVMLIAGGGTGAGAFLLILGYYFVRRARIPFIIKKIDQSIKLIGKGEMPQPVPMRTRTQLVKSIFETKLEIMSKEKLEEAEGKKKVSKEAVIGPEKIAPQGLPKGAEAPAKAEAEESDVDLVAKELEKLEAREEKKPSDETELIKREIEELEKGSKKKRKSESS